MPASQQSDVVEFVGTFILEVLLEFLHLIVDALESLRVADVVGFDVGLYEQRVVDVELWIEPEGTERGQEHVLLLIVTGLDIVRHETTQTGHDDAIVAQQKYLNMSFKFNHVCKITANFGNKQIKET